MKRKHWQFSLRTLLLIVTTITIAVALVTNFYEVAVAVVWAVIWAVDLVYRSGFVEAWPELSGPKAGKWRPSSTEASNETNKSSEQP